MIDVADSNAYYYHYDGLGSVVALSDENGNIAEKYQYDVYGSPMVLSLRILADEPKSPAEQPA